MSNNLMDNSSSKESGGAMPEDSASRPLLIQDAGPVTVLNGDEKRYGSFQIEKGGGGGGGTEETDRKEDRSRDYWYWLLLACLGWSSLYLVTHGEVLPPAGGLFQLLALVALASLAGALVGLASLPPLLGMLLMGIALRSSGYLQLEGVYADLVVISRNLALSVILLKAGLGLDPAVLSKLKFTVLRLAALPCLVEAGAAALAANLLLGVPWLWAFLIGFILSPISPAVVVPTLLSLKERGYGEDKGIATLVIASSSIDDILSISVFGVIMASIFSPGGDMTLSILRGPMELVGGLAGGCLWGCLLGHLPHPHDSCQSGTSRELMLSWLLGLGGFVAVLGSLELDIPGAGPLLTITSSFVANLVWTQRRVFPEGQSPVADRFSTVWSLVQPALFGLIGAEVDLRALDPSLLLSAFLILVICLAARLVACILCLIGIGLNWKEMIFVNLAWVPKATVQAALAPQPLDLLRGLLAAGEEDGADGLDPAALMYYARLLLTTAVLAIVITAPLGSLGISITGPRFLSKATTSNSLAAQP